jgi:parallel beta-helix repeat protein
MRTLRVATATLLACIASACSDVTSPAATAPSATSIVPALSLAGGTGETGALTNRLAGKCVDVYGGSTANGAAVTIYPCHGGGNQQFTWLSDGTIRVYGGSMCLDAYAATGKDGDAVVIWSCHGGANQRWTATSSGEIRGINGKCLDLVNANPADGTRVMIWNCYQSQSQKWDNGAASSQAPAQAPAAPPAYSGVPISPGQSIQAAVNANPAGTQFLIKAGTHVRQMVIPKAGDVFQGEPGAVMDGQGATQWAFRGRNGSTWINNVTIRGLKITGYTPLFQDGAISPGDLPGDATSGWWVDNCEVSYNTQYGIRIGDNMRITNNNVHHNVVLNIGGAANNTVIEGNEIAWGNYTRTGNTNYEAGGTKFSVTDGLVLRNNYVHDNQGGGLHLDTDNINALIEGNRVENNSSEGIVQEIGYRTTIRNNTVTNNGWSDPRGRLYLWNAGIAVHASPDVEIYGNTVSGNMSGIVAIQQNRGSGRFGPHIVQNMYVHDYSVTQPTWGRPGDSNAAAGAVQDVGDNGVFSSSRNNRFVHNTYYLGANVRPFEWNNGNRDEATWKSLGQDTNASFNR